MSEARPYFHLERSSMDSDSYCGPAVLQMLLSNVGVRVKQDDVVLAGDAVDRVVFHGMRVDQLAQAATVLAPQTQFWYKDASTLDDLIQLVRGYQFPVGVEWQGYFDDEGGPIPDPEPDYGHYSVVTHVDRDRDELIIVDPNKEFVAQDRIFGLEEFDLRWWDFNEVPDLKTGIPMNVKDDHMMFIVTPRDETFPARLGMKRG